MENNDILYQAAKIFEEIKSYKIEITIGRKGQAEVFTIIFEDSDFHHLAGLHKLTDIVQVYKQNASIVFSKILEREICLSDLEASVFVNIVVVSFFQFIQKKNLLTVGRPRHRIGEEKLFPYSMTRVIWGFSGGI